MSHPAIPTQSCRTALSLLNSLDIDAALFEDTCRRRFFFGQSFEAYKGVAGFYDFGPPLTQMKLNLMETWRQHFVAQESMCELALPAITMQQVLRVSGHEERFADIMVRDTVTGENYRADKLIEDWVDTQLTKGEKQESILMKLRNDAGAFNVDEIREAIKANGIQSPMGNTLSDPFPFNLMFGLDIGPSQKQHGYLRPELAQGIILNFRRLLDTGHASSLPFAACSVGTAYRNEIAPRGGLQRLREFYLAEIEHFCDPEDTSHPKFDSVADLSVWAWDRVQQEQPTGSPSGQPTKRTIRELFETQYVMSETVGYFMARAAMFVERIGIRHYRFRQHRSNELAHYAKDCWDIECLSSSGFLECIGIADRSAYDLERHANATQTEMSAWIDYSEPRTVTITERVVDKRLAGKLIGRQTGPLVKAIENLTDEQAAELRAEMNRLGPESFEVITVISSSPETSVPIPTQQLHMLLKFQEVSKRITGRFVIPNVVEPTFGIGRLLLVILEQSYWVRADETGYNDKRAVFSLIPAMAPIKVAVLRLIMKDTGAKVRAEIILTHLREAGVACHVDNSSASIGKKYARIDELGIPFVVTCDGECDTVTLRDRDTTRQIRLKLEQVLPTLQSLCSEDNVNGEKTHARFDTP